MILLIPILELLNQHPENLRTLLKHTVFNELSAARNPNNMIILTAIFQHSGETSAETLAEIFQDLLLKDAVSVCLCFGLT